MDQEVQVLQEVVVKNKNIKTKIILQVDLIEK